MLKRERFHTLTHILHEEVHGTVNTASIQGEDIPDGAGTVHTETTRRTQYRSQDVVRNLRKKKRILKGLDTDVQIRPG